MMKTFNSRQTVGALSEEVQEKVAAESREGTTKKDPDKESGYSESEAEKGVAPPEMSFVSRSRVRRPQGSKLGRDGPLQARRDQELSLIRRVLRTSASNEKHASVGYQGPLRQGSFKFSVRGRCT